MNIHSILTSGRNLRLPTTAIIALASSAPASAGFTNLIADGSFENPSTLTGTYAVFPGGSTVGSWASAGVEVAIVNGAYSSGGFTYQAHSGSQWMDLSGATNPNPSNRVSQTIATDVGTLYELTFYLGSAWGGAPQMLQPIIEVTVGSNSPISFTNLNAATGGQMNWELFSLTFVATGTTTNIAFNYGNPVGVSNFAVGLDTVSAVVVPAPGAIAVVAIAAASASRRRK